ncbi:MAG TPA: MFS transporter [Actinomycetes bacterium]|nr:MFS transporter [Actinomycetes bacterium]
MSTPYLQLLRTQGGWQFSIAGFFARLPLAMGGFALLLLMVDITDSYFVAGAVDATWILVGAGTAPVIALLIDRFGQSRVIGPQITINVIAVTAILIFSAVDAPLWAFFLAAAVAGAALPVIGSIVRSRWTYLLGSSELLRTAFSWESVVDEFVFIVGPPLAAFTAATFGSAAAVGLTAALGASGTYALILQRSTEPPARTEGGHRGRLAIFYAGMPEILVVMAALGLLFAGIEVTVVATARETGNIPAAGIVLAIWSVSSMVTGFVLGGLRRSPPLYKQLLVGCVLLAAMLVPLLASQNLLTTAVILFFAGAAVSPTLIAGFTFVERLVPPARLTEALTWASTALAVGFALGSPSSGWLVDHVGLSAGYWVGVISAILACAAAIAGRNVLTELSKPSD